MDQQRRIAWGLPLVEELFSAARTHRVHPSWRTVRERRATIAMAVAFLAIAIPMAVLTTSERDPSLGLAAVLVALYTVASLVEFEVGSGSAVPTQIVLVPMLFLVPTGWTPLMAAAGFVLAGIIGRLLRHPDQSSFATLVSTSWYAIGPAAVLLAVGEQPLSWSSWPIYAAAFAAQFVLDATSAVVADTLSFGTRPTLSLLTVASVYAADALLAPIGLSIAALAVLHPIAVFLTLPLIGLLALFASDRRARINGLLELGEVYRGTAVMLGEVIEVDDAYTGDHSQGVLDLSLAVADSLGLDATARRQVEFTALLHDVGKLRVDKAIINKPGPLDEHERSLVELHTLEGEQLLQRAGGYLGEIGLLVRSCHERFDGAGYPDRLAGDEIPLVARIVACCDAYDAMTTDRVYRSALGPEQAQAEVAAGAGRQFDPTVAKALLEIVGAGELAAATAAPVTTLHQRRDTPVPLDVIAVREQPVIEQEVEVAEVHKRSRNQSGLLTYALGTAMAVSAPLLAVFTVPSLDGRTAALFGGLAVVYGIAHGVRFAIGPGSSVPTQLALVPMLAHLPAGLIPLAAALGMLARSAWDADVATCPARQRPFMLLTGAWHTVPPAAVLLVADRPLDWTLLAIGLALQVALDAAINFVHVHRVLGYPARSLLRTLAWTYAADIALTPIAFTAAAPERAGNIGTPAAVVALLGFLGLVARDRRQHLDRTRRLAEAYEEAALRARRDPLTGLTNRLGWDDALAARDPSTPAAIVLLDLDGLKAANDSRGHAFGDRVLQEFATALQRAAPNADVVARIGGDEFAIMLVGENAVGADRLAVRLRATFAGRPSVDGFRMGAGVGYASVTGHGDIAAAIARADLELYAEKARGRSGSRVLGPGRVDVLARG